MFLHNTQHRAQTTRGERRKRQPRPWRSLPLAGWWVGGWLLPMENADFLFFSFLRSLERGSSIFSVEVVFHKDHNFYPEKWFNNLRSGLTFFDVIYERLPSWPVPFRLLHGMSIVSTSWGKTNLEGMILLAGLNATRWWQFLANNRALTDKSSPRLERCWVFCVWDRTSDHEESITTSAVKWGKLNLMFLKIVGESAAWEKFFQQTTQGRVDGIWVKARRNDEICELWIVEENWRNALLIEKHANKKTKQTFWSEPEIQSKNPFNPIRANICNPHPWPSKVTRPWLITADASTPAAPVQRTVRNSIRRHILLLI